MIPVYNHDPQLAKISESSDVLLLENCVFCHKPTTTWHENSNNPICVTCAKSHKIADIPEDHGQNIRAMKKAGTFSRGVCTKAN